MRARSMEKVGVWWKAAKSCFVRGTRRGDTWRGGDSLRYGGKYQYCTHPSLSQPSSGLLLKRHGEGALQNCLADIFRFLLNKMQTKIPFQLRAKGTPNSAKKNLQKNRYFLKTIFLARFYVHNLSLFWSILWPFWSIFNLIQYINTIFSPPISLTFLGTPLTEKIC